MNGATSAGATLLRRVIGMCRSRRTVKIVDSTGAELTGPTLLLRALVLRRILQRRLATDERYVGILLPPTVAGVVTNLALSLDSRVTVNLNYTLTPALIDSCIRQASIRHIITSRRFLDRTGLQCNADPIFLEDLKDAPTLPDKVTGALLAYAMPIPFLVRLLGVHRLRTDEEMTVIFTSGTTGDPKGAVLTFGNVSANVDTVDRVIHLNRDDVVLGILPFFHSFGFIITLWAALAHDVKAAYHVNPLDARAIGQLCREQKGTILLATPSFLRTYTRRCSPEDFSSVQVVVTGAERLPSDLANAFEQKFGIRPVEGYGTTELAALIASNVPPSRARGSAATVCREGTVGRPVPGVRVKAVDLETGADLRPGEQGMLWATGPNVMKGYLGQPETTAAVIRDGWYVTGDVGIVHADGCIELAGRVSRFAKIAGEMVPLVRIEEALAAIAGNDDDGPRIAVTAIPDEVRGERIVVVHTPLAHTPHDLRRALVEAGLPNLFIPSAGSFVEVDALPMLGTGKLDLRQIRELALRHFESVAEAASRVTDSTIGGL